MIIQTYAVTTSQWFQVTAPARVSGWSLRALTGDVTIAGGTSVGALSSQADANQQDTLYDGEQEALQGPKAIYETGQTICYLKANNAPTSVKGYFVPVTVR